MEYKQKHLACDGMYYERPHNQHKGYGEQIGFRFSGSRAPKIPPRDAQTQRTYMGTWRNVEGPIHLIINYVQ